MEVPRMEQVCIHDGVIVLERVGASVIPSAAMENDPVSEVVWNWRKPAARRVEQSPAVRRRHAVIEFCVVLAVSMFVRFVLKHEIMSTIILCIGSIVLIGGLFIPPVYHGFKRFGAALGRVLALVVTWILLVPFFYIFFTIARLGCLIQGKDLMCRRFDADATTYWVDHPGTPPPEQYRKQY